MALTLAHILSFIYDLEENASLTRTQDGHWHVTFGGSQCSVFEIGADVRDPLEATRWLHEQAIDRLPEYQRRHARRVVVTSEVARALLHDPTSSAYASSPLTLTHVLFAICAYEQTIELSLASDWDNGWRVALANTRYGPFEAAAWVDDLLAAGRWLHENARRGLPQYDARFGDRTITLSSRSGRQLSGL